MPYAGERFVITKDDKEVAALVSIEELRRIERLEDLLDVLAVQLLKAPQDGKPLPVDALLKQYECLFDERVVGAASRARS